MKSIVFCILFCYTSLWSFSQHRHHGHKVINNSDSLSSSLGRDLDKGTFEFHKRSFFMQTINKGDLMNYNALASGAGLGYYSPSWKGFHIGFSGFFVFQLFENNIYKADTITNNTNRYEILLFDMNDFENKRDLDRLEEFYFTYEQKRFFAIMGRQKFESPLLNEQDNRMRANLYNGLSVSYSDSLWSVTGAWFKDVTIRGTVDWYSIEESYGVYPFGRNPFGTASGYKDEISTKGIGVLGAKYKTKNKKNKSEIWNYFNENVFNLTFAQTEFKLPVKSWELLLGGQGFYQTAINYGGNENQLKTYILKNESTYGYGSRVGIQKGKHSVTLNYLGISDQGRFLFPREWGREQFFATLPRERFEGAGAVNALMMKYTYKIPDKGWEFFIGASKVDHANLEEYRHNKYGIPSYFHAVASVDYKFKGYLEGMDIRFFVANKTAQNPKEIPDEYRINRVDLWNFNLIIDYRF